MLLRRVDIVNWQSPAAQQANREFGMDAIPYVRVYGTKGDLVGTFVGGDYLAIEQAVRREAK